MRNQQGTNSGQIVVGPGERNLQITQFAFVSICKDSWYGTHTLLIT